MVTIIREKYCGKKSEGHDVRISTVLIIIHKALIFSIKVDILTSRNAMYFAKAYFDVLPLKLLT